MALGPGGLPANLAGWVCTSGLRLLKRETLSTAMYPAGGPLQLPPRGAPRPTVGAWPVPHRQLDQRPTSSLRQATIDLVPEIVATHPDRLHLATSKFERRGQAAFVSADDSRGARPHGTRGEIGHVHESDGSLHLILSPADARTVIEQGWGERHPLCGAPVVGLPPTYVLIYAPRDEQELEIVAELLRRAARFAGALG